MCEEITISDAYDVICEELVLIRRSRKQKLKELEALKEKESGLEKTAAVLRGLLKISEVV